MLQGLVETIQRLRASGQHLLADFLEGRLEPTAEQWQVIEELSLASRERQPQPAHAHS
jgi:hypothetical protein